MADGTDRGGGHDALLGDLRALAERAALAAGVELVDLHVAGSSRGRRIRVDVDRPGPVSVNHDDCRAVSSALDREIEETGLVPDRYTLEVSSPGIDRPIRSADDARRNVGRRVVVMMQSPLDGRNEFRGVLQRSAVGVLCVVDDAIGEVQIPCDRIAIARQDIAF